MKYLILSYDWRGWSNKPLLAKLDSRPDLMLSQRLWGATPLDVDPKLSFTVPTSAPLPDFLGTGSTLMLFSDDFLGLLKRFGVLFESFPVTLKDNDNNPVERNYGLFHLLQVTSIVDKTRSKILSRSHIESIQLSNLGDAPEYSMIRDSFIRSRVFVREDLQRLIEESGIAGCTWHKAEDLKFVMKHNYSG